MLNFVVRKFTEERKKEKRILAIHLLREMFLFLMFVCHITSQTQIYVFLPSTIILSSSWRRRWSDILRDVLGRDILSSSLACLGASLLLSSLLLGSGSGSSTGSLSLRTLCFAESLISWILRDGDSSFWGNIRSLEMKAVQEEPPLWAR